MNRRSRDDRGQVLSSLVAVLAVVAIVGGLLVLFGTRGNDSVADSGKPAASPTPKPSPKPSAPVSSAPPAEPSSTPPPVEPSAPTSVTPSGQPSAPPSAPASIPVTERPAVEVYNNTPRKGLAEDVSVRARQAGWIVTGKDNWHGKIVASTVYFPAGMQAEANQLARDLGIGRTKDALDNMKKDRLTVILTTDYAG
ncbi:LytR C-terminal domain-containing protein [Kribbella sp. NBC_00382]|uniref:LytR C-terminal domain-containing protein n=1 Tax=Kribbella sp. NBC_00382 TaxID=2975967 RepID=UPI002E23D268